MFLLETKTAIVKSLRSTFNGGYPVVDFRDIRVSIEFPVLEQDYPCLWVDFEPSQSLKTAGISHVEYATDDDGLTFRVVERWRFWGYVTVTAVGLSSAVRDQLCDELIRVCAFGRTDPASSPFRQSIEAGNYIAMDFSWDEISLQQMSSVPGTPWGSDEYLYEGTIRVGCQGEFISDPATQTLVPMASLVIYPRREDEPDEPAGDGWQ